MHHVGADNHWLEELDYGDGGAGKKLLRAVK